MSEPGSAALVDCSWWLIDVTEIERYNSFKIAFPAIQSLPKVFRREEFTVSANLKPRNRIRSERLSMKFRPQQRQISSKEGGDGVRSLKIRISEGGGNGQITTDCRPLKELSSSSNN
ncbi:hypothetical protein HAX54_024743, partial [Datura stramonium]|nr:hypothetical protein [Datura stramonium]